MLISNLGEDWGAYLREVLNQGWGDLFNFSQIMVHGFVIYVCVSSSEVSGSLYELHKLI